MSGCVELRDEAILAVGAAQEEVPEVDRPREGAPDRDFSRGVDGDGPAKLVLRVPEAPRPQLLLAGIQPVAILVLVEGRAVFLLGYLLSLTHPETTPVRIACLGSRVTLPCAFGALRPRVATALFVGCAD